MTDAGVPAALSTRSDLNCAQARPLNARAASYPRRECAFEITLVAGVERADLESHLAGCLLEVAHVGISDARIGRVDQNRDSFCRRNH
jgi:hypothetical protein